MSSLKLMGHPSDEMEPMDTLNLKLSLTDRDRALPVVFKLRTLLFEKDVGGQNQRPEANERLCAHHLVLVEAQQLFTVGEQHLNGIVASDKFCMTRMHTLDLTWRRGPRPTNLEP